MLVQRNGHIAPYHDTYRDAFSPAYCYAVSAEKKLLIERYRQRIENGLGIFETPPAGEEFCVSSDSVIRAASKLIGSKRFRRIVFAMIRKAKKITVAQATERFKHKYSTAVLQYFFDWCVKNKLLLFDETVYRKKKKTFYYMR